MPSRINDERSSFPRIALTRLDLVPRRRPASDNITDAGLEERPHQSLDNAPLKKPKQYGRPTKQHASVDKQIVPLWEVSCKQRLGGLPRSYSRKAA